MTGAETEAIEIRRAILGDQTALANLCAIVQELHLRQRPDVFKPVNMGELERWFGHVLASGSARIWIAEAAGPVAAGYALIVDQRGGENVFCHPRHWYELQQIGVHAGYRRRGIARALLGRVVESAIADKVQDIELNAWSFNEPAQLAFRELGFAPRNVRFGLSITTAP